MRIGTRVKGSGKPVGSVLAHRAPRQERRGLQARKAVAASSGEAFGVPDQGRRTMGYTKDVKAWAQERFAGQNERLEAIEGFLDGVRRVSDDASEHARLRVLERLIVPEQEVAFPVVWEMDDGTVRVQRGWRVRQSTLLGPGKGGLRFHRAVTDSVVGFLAFEQLFKNALTGLSLGAAKGGADVDPRELSMRERERFAKAFARAVHPWVGAQEDVPAGDMGVGAREIGWIAGEHRRLTRRWDGTYTGKSPEWGGSLLRPEATGYGLVYFLGYMLHDAGIDLEGARVALSGAGNVALHAAALLVQRGAKVVTLSNSRGCLVMEEGLSERALEYALHAQRDGSVDLEEISAQGGEWVKGGVAWDVPCDVALPCATQGELQEEHAVRLAAQGCKVVAEGANLPTTLSAIAVFRDRGIRFGPAKAANAGGVAVSGLEMAQNRAFLAWDREEVDRRLRTIMRRIHDQAASAAEEAGAEGDLLTGADIAAYRRVSAALIAQGVG